MSIKRDSSPLFWLAIWGILVLIAREVLDVLEEVWPLILFLIFFVWLCKSMKGL